MQLLQALLVQLVEEVCHAEVHAGGGSSADAWHDLVREGSDDSPDEAGAPGEQILQPDDQQLKDIFDL